MMRTVTFAATQLALSDNLDANLNRAEAAVRRAAEQGAQVILLQELFEALYFCKKQKADYLALANPLDNHPWLPRFAALAKELEVVLPISFFERANNNFFNSLVMIDADGRVLDCYRKSHIPDGPGYSEKFYFSPGDSGFKVWDTRYGRFGAAICWDQWFPEAARAMVLDGAEALFYPTAIGSEPQDPSLDSKDHWHRVMQGHAAANMVPVIASNRIGIEQDDEIETTFYGSSFITDETGGLLIEADRSEETVLLAEIDLDAAATNRRSWGLFRDRRPELYGALSKLAP
ncbi:N-carbamoylputrescine amidase [uncultured Ferrimonas sp.]|uniref:N-carbamoylputrescine amidase n=1 Tax=uncultured Ferrimonas sp. TaxID=432640 RepID=UPI002610E66B|nr:N-carbamoylputrescine amidase [uncultured Ferrimonas sp.]